ncbi:glycosyltransferase [Halomonas dongshanensis]|uniref:Glycosyltransferase n=1 Tax=Halomonas dongshanensis TaxID=2890835 RepID=A0ABT2EC34_9GAMM|nr:glycosyltransferase [Halomonas dongshanensis]MCS2609146.1 glycosyltransferase [Halomonas dongshanensis]
MLASLTRAWRRWRHKSASGTNPEERAVHARFDPEWYLTKYPDVAAAGLDPWQHYWHHGRFENRLPRRNRALEWDHALWRGAENVVLSRLGVLVNDQEASEEERFTARLAFARWYRWKEQWEDVIKILAPQGVLIEGGAPLTPNPALLLVEACCRLSLDDCESAHQGLLDQALTFLERAFPDTADTALAKANAQHPQGDVLQALNRFYARRGLQTLTPFEPALAPSLDNLTANATETDDTSVTGALVSVIVPVYNAQAALDTVLRGLCAQRGVRLEILAVDDASEDESVAVLERWQACCPSHVSLVVLRHESNQGAYAVRNTGAAHASGAFITVHDSDDWSHPEKLCQQLVVLKENASAKASLSHWVRATPELLFHRWRLDEYGWVYPNISSLMIRREVLETLGFWDEVKVNADTEYRERIEAAYGAGSVVEVLPGVPLSFGRSSLNSLSQQSASHVVSQFGGMRYHYMEAARQWHRQAQAPSDLYLPRNPSARSFQAPVAMLRTLSEALNASLSDEQRLRASSLFDPGWYLERYIDLQSAMIEPFDHFCTVGAGEGRDPGPDFSTTGYARRFQQALSESGLAAWAHYLRAVEDDRARLDDALPIWEGERAHVGRPTVMLCAHQVGATLFGAERSLLDVLDALNTLAYNVVVLLPEAGNAAYEAMLLARCKALAVVPYGWWQQGKHPHPKTVAHIGRLLARFAIDVVHVNTLVLDEPLAAAREANIPTVVHVRELPAFDRALCQTLGATPEQIVERTHAVSDMIIANSEAVAQAFQGRGSTPVRIVPNTITMAPLLALLPPKMDAEEPFRVGMLSSNLPKKGLDDIVRVARGLENDAPHIRLELFGPLSPALTYILHHSPPANLHYGGYIADPSEALKLVHAVVNLSHFQESFGRTVLEAMAASRPVVAYAWGALPELIIEGENGYLVPFGDTEAVAECLLRLSLSHDLCCRLGNAGRQRATEHYSAARLAQALRKSYDVLDAV